MVLHRLIRANSQKNEQVYCSVGKTFTNKFIFLCSHTNAEIIGLVCRLLARGNILTFCPTTTRKRSETSIQLTYNGDPVNILCKDLKKCDHQVAITTLQLLIEVYSIKPFLNKLRRKMGHNTHTTYIKASNTLLIYSISKHVVYSIRYKLWCTCIVIVV